MYMSREYLICIPVVLIPKISYLFFISNNFYSFSIGEILGIETCTFDSVPLIFWDIVIFKFDCLLR